MFPGYGTPVLVKVISPYRISLEILGMYMGSVTCDTSEDYGTSQHLIKEGDTQYALSANELSGNWELVGTHRTEKAEQDIELIPAGTIVWSVKSGELGISNAKCYINGRQREILVYTNNLL